MGLAATTVLAVGYPIVDARIGQPLAVFVLPALFTAVISTAWSTALVGSVASVVATAEGLASGLSGWALVARLGIIVVGSVLAGIAAESRARREHDLVQQRVSVQVADVFQRNLVPRPVAPAGIRVTTRYLPGGNGLRIGGDFVDLVTLDDGAAGFVIGDVTGHGPGPAAFGTAIRCAWKAVAQARPDAPETWLEMVEHAYLRDGLFDGFATALTGRLDPANGRTTLVSAGHPWPLHLTRDGVSMVEIDPGPPLGLHPGRCRPTNELQLDHGHGLLAYTDGLIENRPGCGRYAEDELIVLTGEHNGSVSDGELPDALLDALGSDGFADDVAVLLVTRT